MIDLQLKQGHRRVKMYPIQVVHRENLAIMLITITRFRTLCGFPYFPWSGGMFSTTNDITVANDEHELSFGIIVEGSEGVDHATQGIFAFSVTQYLTENEFVEQLRCMLAMEL